MLLIQILVFCAGAWLVGRTFLSAVVTFVLPRSAPDGITRGVFLLVRRVFDLRVERAQSYEERDRAMALYAPVSLLALPPTWLLFIGCGFTAMFWATGLAPGE